MTPTVREFMNPQLVYLRENSRPELALHPILDFGITAVPVLDENDRPVGLISLRDLADTRKHGAPLTTSLVSVGIDEPVLAAARVLANSNVHHLVVLDRDGRAVGMLSAVDVVRALLGLPATHPVAIDTFGRNDAIHGAPVQA
jgi:CBS domain-containing protein